MLDPNTTDDVKRLLWLRDHVSITVAKLVAKGYQAEVAKALSQHLPQSGPSLLFAETATTGPTSLDRPS
jgi:hypothetical protein